MRTSAIYVKKPRGRPLCRRRSVTFVIPTLLVIVGCERVWCIITCTSSTKSIICINFKTKNNSHLLSNPLCGTEMYVLSLIDCRSLCYRRIFRLPDFRKKKCVFPYVGTGRLPASIVARNRSREPWVFLRG